MPLLSTLLRGSIIPLFFHGFKSFFKRLSKTQPLLVAKLATLFFFVLFFNFPCFQVKHYAIPSLTLELVHSRLLRRRKSLVDNFKPFTERLRKELQTLVLTLQAAKVVPDDVNCNSQHAINCLLGHRLAHALVF